MKCSSLKRDADFFVFFLVKMQKILLLIIFFNLCD